MDVEGGREVGVPGRVPDGASVVAPVEGAYRVDHKQTRFPTDFGNGDSGQLGNVGLVQAPRYFQWFVPGGHHASHLCGFSGIDRIIEIERNYFRQNWGT